MGHEPSDECADTITPVDAHSTDELLDHERVGHVVETGAAVLLRDEDAEHPEPTQFLNRRARETRA